jgi:lysophospholipase L1-like esterase
LFTEFCQQNELQCLDEWNLVSADEFTNSAIHMTPAGTRQLAEKLEDAIRSLDVP